MNFHAINALIAKDFSLFFRNRFFAIITFFAIAVYVVIYFVMPGTVDETLKIGLYAPVVPPAFEAIEEEGLEIEIVDSEEALKQAVVDGQHIAGIALPPDIMDKFLSGQKPGIDVYFTSTIPDEIKDIVLVIVKEVAFQQIGQELAIDVSEEILGPDMVGKQIPPRDRLRPFFAIFIIIFETFGLASLISEEVEKRTIQALLVTPMTIKELFFAKGIVGMTLAFGQAALFMVIAGGINTQPVIILITLLLGAALVTGIGFLLASVGKDMMSVMGWGFIALIILAVPSFGIVFPGTISGWAEIIPSYYLVDTIHRVSNFGAGWNDIGYNLLILLGFDMAFIYAGIITLGRKFQ